MIDEKKLIEELEESWFKNTHISSEGKEVHDQEHRYLLRLIKRQPKVGEWIPVSERLPGNTDEVLIYVELLDDVKHTFIGFFDGDDWFDCEGYTLKEGYKNFIDCFPQSNPKVIAWMPLPPKYEG